MKKLFVLLALVGFSKNYAQASKSTQNENLASYTGQTGGGLLDANNAQLGGFTFFNPARDVVGTTHLFEKWENRGIIVSNDGKKYAINNINLDLRRQAFQSKYEGNKLFTFNFNNIDKFIINNKVYKNYYYDDDVSVYEILVDASDYQLLKGYKLKFVEGSANPMLNRNIDRYIKKEFYCVKKGDKITPFKFKKKKFIKLVGEAKAEQMLEYADTNKLSFKRENDIKIILESLN